MLVNTLILLILSRSGRYRLPVLQRGCGSRPIIDTTYLSYFTPKFNNYTRYVFPVSLEIRQLESCLSQTTNQESIAPVPAFF
ncbi:hypothetical protein ACLKA6_018724 [Drosophila palustris]